MPTIEVDHVTKEFRLGQLQSLKQTTLNGLRRVMGRPVEGQKVFKALDDVSFTIEQGEVLGIIGHNGAGKSTLLKILAGISRPTRGNATVRGRVAPLIEVGAGLVSDLTGRENVFLNAAILGMKRSEIVRRFDEIVAFAELEQFIDTPIKRYSSGMQVRLGFSIATSAEAGILLVDEVLAVGDLAFQRKCFDKMENMIKRQGRTVIVVSHNIRQVERLCSRVILMDHGCIGANGAPREVCNKFYEQSDRRIADVAKDSRTQRAGRLESVGAADLLTVAILNTAGRRIDCVSIGESVTIEMTIRANKKLIRPIFAVGVHTTDFLYLATENSFEKLIVDSIDTGTHAVRCVLGHFPFLPGVYSLRMSIVTGEIPSEIFYGENLLHFSVTSKAVVRTIASGEGFFPLDGEWSISSQPSTDADHQAASASQERVRHVPCDERVVAVKTRL